MNSWAITNLDLRPHAPEILASTNDTRATSATPCMPARTPACCCCSRHGPESTILEQ